MKRPCLLAAVTLLLFGVYLYHAASTLTLGDSGELAAVGATLGIAHPPGYPLYSVLAKAGSVLIPLGNAAYRMAVWSSLWTAAAAGMVGWALLMMGASLPAAVLSSLLLGLGPVWMGQAVVTEVFALNSCVASVLLLLLTAIVQPGSDTTRDRRSLTVLSIFILGLGLCNHHTLLFLVPSFGLVLFTFRSEFDRRSWLLIPVFFATGLSLYLFIWIRAQTHPVMNWEEPEMWHRFWNLVTRARYGTLQLAQGGTIGFSGDEFLMQSHYVARVFWDCFGPFVAFLFWGLYAGFRKRGSRQLTGVLILALLFCGPLFLTLTHVKPGEHSRILLDRFTYLFLLPAGFLIGMGLEALFASTQRRRLVPLIVGLLVVCWQAVQAYPLERADFSVYDFGRDLLRNTPPEVVLFSDRADEAEFALAYLQRVEGRRPDVRFIDCNAGVSPSIYGPDYYEIWGRPRLAIRTATEKGWIEHGDRPVYYATHDPQMIPIQRYQNGLLYAAGTGAARRMTDRWQEVLIFRRNRGRPGALSPWDRGLHADYLQTLAHAALLSGHLEDAALIYQGVFAYTGPSPWRQQVEQYLAAVGQVMRNRAPSRGAILGTASR